MAEILCVVPHQGVKGPVPPDSPEQQQGTWSATPQHQTIQKKVAVTGQQQQGVGGAPQASRGGMGNQQQNRVRHKCVLAFFCALDTSNYLP